MKKRIKYFVAGAVLLAAGGLLMAAENPDFKLGRSIEVLINMFRDINMFYVDETDPEKLLEDAAMGLTMRLDPYTEYMPASEMEQFSIMTTGKYGGIGSLIRKKGEYITIAQPYEGSPADKAGLQIGDRLVEVDSVNVVGMESDKVSELLKGDPGTPLRLKVRKLVPDKEVTVDLIRERIAIPGVPYHGMVADGIGYIQHVDFSENCSADMRRAFTEMSKDGNLKGLVLDYRGNGGGILQEAVKILSMFVPKGTEVVSMRGRTPEMSSVFKTELDPIDLDIPIVVLTNSGTASAAEIVSGALQDLDRAVLVGQRTFGKGLVQMTRPVGYNSYLKVTTAKYYIPSGRCIQAIDYAHRNEDGSVSSVPDSLITEYATSNGRKVYDGGGIMPDVKVAPEYVSLFTVIAYQRGYIDDFGDEYTRRNPQPIDIETFTVNDRIYNEFCKFMEDKDVEYQSQTIRALADLKDKAQRELYYNDIKDELAAIESRLKDDKKSSLELYREQLSELIKDDLIRRHYYARGVTQAKLKEDRELAEAIALLQQRERYDRIISSQDTERK